MSSPKPSPSGVATLRPSAELALISTFNAGTASFATAEIRRSNSADSPSETARRDHAAITAAPDPIITIDASGIILSASDATQRVLGWSPADLLGHHITTIIPESHRLSHQERFQEHVRTGISHIASLPHRFEALCKDGSLVPVDLCISRADIPGSASPLFVGILRDMRCYAEMERCCTAQASLTHRQLAEQTSALQHAHEQLRMSDRMASLGTLAAGLGHDMNNVLLPVRARLDVLKESVRKGNIPAAERKHIDDIRKSVAYLQQLADSLHSLSLDPDTKEDVRGGGAATDLHKWWHQAGVLLSQAVPRHVRVIASFPADLPKAGLAPHGLTQAILNLVVNAGEAIPSPRTRKRRQGYVRLTAVQSEDARGRWIRLSVSDNGTGMTEEVKRRLFDLFFTTKPRGLGTGLGMTLVRNVIERTGGRIEIASELNHGTTITLIIPVARGTTLAGNTDTPRSAVISLNDGRAGAIIEHLLETSGVSLRLDRDPSQAHFWVVDPTMDLARLNAWRDLNPRGRLILCGKPVDRAETWAALSPLVIENPAEFEELRSALSSALTLNAEET